MNVLTLRTAAAIALGAAAAATQASSISIDAQFDDWRTIPALATDPVGDARGAFDITAVSATTAGTTLFLKLDLASSEEPVNLQSGSTSDGTVRITLELDDATATLDTREKSVTIDREGEPTESTNWAALRTYSLPTFAAETYEFHFDLSRIGAEIGDTLRVAFDGSDKLDQGPISVTLTDEPATPSSVTKPDRHADADLRVAAFNTLRGGLLDPERRDAFRRLLRAANADVFCFQEEWDTTETQAAEALEALLPTPRGTAWNVHKVSGCLVATQLPLSPVSTPEDARFAAAIVTTEAGAEVAVMSVHFKCCGHAGSSEDTRRIREASAVADTVATLRETLGPEIPTIVTGDWNLVGSRRPLDVLTSSATQPALTKATLRCLSGTSAVTWHNENSPFAPGMLDLLAYGGDADMLKGFVINTRTLPSRTLESTDLRADDSIRASDHLVLVADFDLTAAEQ